MTGVGALPGAAPVAMAQLEAAAAGVRPQGMDVGTQNSLNVVLEKVALMLGGMGDKQGYKSHTHTRRTLRTLHTLDLANDVSPHSTTPAAPSAALSPSVCTRSVCTQTARKFPPHSQ